MRTVVLHAFDAKNNLVPVLVDESGRLVGSGSTPGSDAGLTPPIFTSSGNMTIVVADHFVPFPDQPATVVSINNDNGLDVLVQQDGAGAAFPVQAHTLFHFYGISNAKQLAVKRSTGTTPVPVNARWTNSQRSPSASGQFL